MERVYAFRGREILWLDKILSYRFFNPQHKIAVICGASHIEQEGILITGLKRKRIKFKKVILRTLPEAVKIMINVSLIQQTLDAILYSKLMNIKIEKSLKK